jgi:hypothetical protein
LKPSPPEQLSWRQAIGTRSDGRRGRPCHRRTQGPVIDVEGSGKSPNARPRRDHSSQFPAAYRRLAASDAEAEGLLSESATPAKLPKIRTPLPSARDAGLDPELRLSHVQHRRQPRDHEAWEASPPVYPTREFGAGHPAGACGRVHVHSPLVEEAFQAWESADCVAAQHRNVLEPRRNHVRRNAKDLGDSGHHVVGWTPETRLPARDGGVVDAQHVGQLRLGQAHRDAPLPETRRATSACGDGHETPVMPGPPGRRAGRRVRGRRR